VDLKRNVRLAKFKELESEAQSYSEECSRLREVLQQ